MGFSLRLAIRYMSSRKRASVSVGTLLAIMGVALGTMALVTVLSVTGGFRGEFREKVLGVNAHVLVLKYASEFREYRNVMKTVAEDPDVVGVSPFVINPMMVTHEQRTATGVLLKGVDPERMKAVLDLPRHMTEGTLKGLRLPGSKPPDRKPQIKSSLASGDPAVDTINLNEPSLSDDDFLKRLRDTAIESGAKEELRLPKGAVVGQIEPVGGFESELPEDDELPEELVGDPCGSGDASELPGIVIGDTLKQNLAVELGDCIQVTSPTIGYRYSRGQLRPPVVKLFRVQGVFRAGFDQYDSKLMYADLYEAQEFYGAGDTVTGVEMRISDIEQSGAVTKRVDKLLSNGIYHTMDWKELNHGLFTALRIQQILMSLVLAVIILVAAFTVIATLIMVVFDKKKEIAVLKAMGASDRDLLLSFLYQGLVIGLGGALLGLGLGYVMCRWVLEYGLPLDPKVYFISKLPVSIKPLSFVLTGVFAVLVCLVACLFPSLHAARLRPAEAFREQ